MSKTVDVGAATFLSDALAEGYTAVQTALKRAKEQGRKKVRFDADEEKAITAAAAAYTEVTGGKAQHFDFDVDFDTDFDTGFDNINFPNLY